MSFSTPTANNGSVQANRTNANNTTNMLMQSHALHIRPTTTSSNPTSTSSSSEEESSLPTLCQVIAMSMCYRRLAFVVGCLPLVCLVTPGIAKMALVVMSWITGGYGFACLVLTAILTWCWYGCLKSVAPTPEKLQQAYQKSHGLLQIIMLLCSTGIFWLISLIESTEGVRFSRLQWSPTISWDIGLRPALSLGLLGVSLLLRYVGPSSLVRCSSVPLVSNHVVRAMRSPRTFLFLLASPSDSVGGNISLNLTNFRLHECGRRYECPSIVSGLANSLFSGIIGYMVAEILFKHYWLSLQPSDPSYEDTIRARSLIDYTCILTILFHLIVTSLNRTGHELNPKHYYSQAAGPKEVPFLSGKALVKLVRRIAIFTIMAPVISFVCVSFLNGQFRDYRLFEWVLIILKEDWAILVFCIVTAASVGIYIGALDETIRVVLCTPGSKLQRFVREVTCGHVPNNNNIVEPSITLEEEETYVLDAMLHSILHGDSNLVKSLWEPTLSRNLDYLDLERYEAERNAYAITRMVKVLLGDKDTKRAAEVSLEEDILRHSILESIGGSFLPKSLSIMGNSKSMAIVLRSSADDYPMGHRHRQAIQYWVLPSSGKALLKTQHKNEPRGVILVRALCAYTGGLGQALIECSRSQSLHTTWVLPPAAVVLAEYSVIALSRCIEHNLQHIKNAAVDWRSSQLSMMIPAAMNSAYRLRLGIIEHARYRNYLDSREPRKPVSVGDLDETFIAQIGKDHPELSLLLRAIDAAVRVILMQLSATAGQTYSTNSVKKALESNCAQWISSLMSTE